MMWHIATVVERNMSPKSVFFYFLVNSYIHHSHYVIIIWFLVELVIRFQRFLYELYIYFI